MVLVGTEALIRARIGPSSARQPTAIYTRPVAWRTPDADADAAVAIGTVDGRMMEQRIPVTLDDVPQHLIDAILAVEDQRFFEHNGLDVRRIGGAFVANVRAGGIAQGGSTITQQLAKNLFLSADRTPIRKLREAALAVVLETRHDKNAILEAYLNEIYLGQDGGRALHGVGAASRYYFGKPAARLSLAEAALLAGMIHAPNRHAPTRNPKSAAERRNLVLQLMADQGRVSAGDAARARRARVATRAHTSRVIDARYFRDYVASTAPGRMPARGGAVYTTLDADLQLAAERAVRSGLAKLRLPGAEAALVAIDPRTGEILAMVGGREYGASQFNRAVEARRQPGSAFKPIVALAALEPSGDDGPAYTLASMVDDEPMRVQTASGPWEPTNYDRTYRGPVTVRRALEQSLNLPFVRIGLDVGPERIAAMARRVGITSKVNPVPSVALGSSEITLLELVRAYGVLAAGGDLATTRAVVARARAGADTVVLDGSTRRTRVIDPAVAYLVTSALQGVVQRGTARAISSRATGGELAGKTGTSNNWRDAWFVTYTPEIVIGVWVGYDDGRSLRLPGGGAALPITSLFLVNARLPHWGEFDVPEGITEGYVTSSDGSWLQECGAREVFLDGTEPGGECVHFDIPEWIEDGDWTGALRREAERFIRGVMERPTPPELPRR
jgi:penicillin-binding protein 1B